MRPVELVFVARNEVKPMVTAPLECFVSPAVEVAIRP